MEKSKNIETLAIHGGQYPDPIYCTCIPMHYCYYYYYYHYRYNHHYHYH